MEKAKQYFCAKPNGKLHYPHTILTGFGFLASSIAWAIYDPYITKILNHLLNNSATITSWSAKLNAAFPALAEFAAANGEDVTTAAGGITLVPLFIGIIMTFDNIFGVIFQPTFGKLSDNTHSRFGKRRPYVIFGAPISAILFAIIPIVAIKVGSLPLTMLFIILFVFVMSLWRAPVVALMPDLTPSDIRSEGNAVINLMGSAGGILVLALGMVFATSAVRNSLMSYIGYFGVIAALMLAALVSVSVLAVLGILLLRPVAMLLGAKGELLDYAVRYGRILMLALPPFALQNMFQSFFVTAEKPLLGFWFTVGAGCTNMVLDVLLVGILHWSVEGAAIATMLSQVVGGLLPVFYFLNRKNTSLLHLCRPQFEGGVLLKACVNGSSELMTNLSMSLVNILYNYQLLRFAGEDGVAAYGVIMYASFLFVAVFVGYAVGSAPIVSYHYGANNRKEVNNLYRKSLKLIGVVVVVMTIGSMFIIPHVARFFVGYDENLLILTTRAFRLYGLSFLIMGFNVYASSFFTALGDGVTSALISFLRTLLFQLPALLLLPALWGIDGVWLAVTAAELAALAVTVYMFVTKDQKFHYRHG